MNMNNENKNERVLTNAGKVRAIAEGLSSLGVSMYPEFGGFALGLDAGFRKGSRNHLYLYSVGVGNLTFCPAEEGTDSTNGGLRPDYGHMWEIPINDFSESFLCSLLATLRAECREKLTAEAYAEVLGVIGELPEVEE